MTTIAEFANELKQRAAGWRARSHTIFNGTIIAEEIQGWADKAAALSPPEPTEGQVEAAAQRIYQAYIDHHGLHDLPSWSQLSEDDRAVYRRDASAALSPPVVSPADLVDTSTAPGAISLQEDAGDGAIAQLREAQTRMLAAWDSLAIGHHTPQQIERWLRSEKMRDAINGLRVLTAAPMVAEEQTEAKS